MIELHIQESSPSINRFHGHHWLKKSKERKKWSWLVRIARMHVRMPMLPPEHCHVAYHRYGARILDFDNMVAGLKFCQDALISEGFAVDDSPAHLTAVYRQFVGKPYRTIIKIWGDREWNQELKATQPKSSPLDTATPSASSKNAILLAEALL